MIYALDPYAIALAILGAAILWFFDRRLERDARARSQQRGEAFERDRWEKQRQQGDPIG